MFKKVNLYGQKWIDTLFEGRNMEYGAYDLRRNESKITVIALVVGAALFALLISAPLLMKEFNIKIGGGRKTIDEKVVLIDLDTPPPPSEQLKDLPPPPPVEEIKSIQEVKRFTQVVVAPETDVTEELVAQKDLKDVTIGRKNIEADEDGEIILTKAAAEKKEAAKIIENTGPIDMNAVEVQPEFPGGMLKFREYIMNELGGITLGDGLTQLRMEFKFIVERNGTLTDVQVIRDGGYPDIAEQAVKVIRNSKKWSPGVMNGKPVRISYKLPIVVQVAN